MDKVDKYLNEEDKSMDILDRIKIETLIRETKEFLDDDELNEKAIEAAGWGKSSVKKFGETIGHDPNKHGFFDACVSRMKGKSGWDKEKANGFCARLIDTAKGTTKWRGKNEENLVEMKLVKDGIYKAKMKGKEVEVQVKSVENHADRAIVTAEIIHDPSNVTQGVGSITKIDYGNFARSFKRVKTSNWI